MTPNDRFERELPRAMADLAAARVPDYLDALLAETARSRQRPAWTHIERWLPMSLVSARAATAPPLRAAWMLLLVALISVALAVSLVIAGSLVRRPGPQQLHALVPVLTADDSWNDAAAELQNPTGIAVGPDGNVYVVSSGSNEVVVLDPGGRELRRWGTTGTADGQFIFQREPTDPLSDVGGIGVAGDGSVYVADQNDRVQRFTSQGDFVGAWGGHGATDGRFLEPFDVAVGPDGSVYVVDDLRDDVQRFSADGAWLQTIGHHGAADGELDFTGGIDVSDDGTVLNADYGNARVQAWDASGAFLWSKSGDLVNPSDVAAAGDGRVVVVDDQGLELFTEGPQSIPMKRPAFGMFSNVAIGADGSVYVSSSNAKRVQRFTVDLREPDASPAPAASSSSASGATTPASASMPPASPVAAGPAKGVHIGGPFAVPFSIRLPSTSAGDPASGDVRAGWNVQTLEAGVVSLQYVRGHDRTPAYVTVYLPAGVFADPCHPDDGMVVLPEKPGVDDFVEALTHQAGFRAGAVTDVSFGQVHGKAFDLENSIDARSCTDEPWLRQWTWRKAGLSGDAVDKSGGLPNTHQRIAIVDVDGVPVLIEGWELGALRDEVIEMESLMDSIRFE
jgi:hypothetical protein